MDDQELRALLDELRALPKETEWAEFKLNYSEPREIGEYISALSNGEMNKKRTRSTDCYQG